MRARACEWLPDVRVCRRCVRPVTLSSTRSVCASTASQSLAPLTGPADMGLLLPRPLAETGLLRAMCAGAADGRKGAACCRGCHGACASWGAVCAAVVGMGPARIAAKRSLHAAHALLALRALMLNCRPRCCWHSLSFTYLISAPSVLSHHY